jgi:hypothetical protein
MATICFAAGTCLCYTRLNVKRCFGFFDCSANFLYIREALDFMPKQSLFPLIFVSVLVLVGCQPLGDPAVNPVPPADYFATSTPLPVLSLPTVTPTPAPSPTPIALDGPVALLTTKGVPERFAGPIVDALAEVDLLEASNGPQPFAITDDPAEATTLLAVTQMIDAQYPLLQRYYAVVAPFETLNDDVSWSEVQFRWRGLGDAPLYVTSDVPELLSPILGTISSPILDRGDLIDKLELTPGALAIVPFDQLDPRMKVLTVAGESLLNEHFDPKAYPLGVAITLQGKGAPLIAEVLTPTILTVESQLTNRNADRLTSLIMTGVTAMSRGTAARMDREGPLYPAMIISDTLAAADITHISNEVPFLDDCVTNNTVDNLRLCSHTDYWAALEAVGTDIVGLSGNHVNDFGREGARRSLTWYIENEIPIYGSGFTPEEACAPLFWTHNGNKFAFVAALAFGPSTAWVTDEAPGACYFYDRKDDILALVSELAGQVDIVAVELQYLETYQPYPTGQQVREFRELREAGADIVTGVQSHVPQAMETYGINDEGGPSMIAYGLGNLFFDQMWSWETRTELMARHTLYNGQLINTEILTAVLENYAQPRWADAQERAGILARIFNASPARPE